MTYYATVQSFVDDNESVVTAVAIVVGALLLARTVDWLISRNAKRVAGVRERIVPGADLELSKAAVTRLRLVRRLLSLTIVVIGVALALNQVAALQPLATTLLASSAVVGLAVGLAARQTLANGVAGLMLATVQPFRIGDVIEWEGSRGRVEDLTLTYTFVRLPSGHRLLIPNERIAASPIENFTIARATVESDISVWVKPARAKWALGALRESFSASSVNIGEVEFDRVELKISFEVSAQAEASERAKTREQAISILDSAGMLGDSPDQ